MSVSFAVQIARGVATAVNDHYSPIKADEYIELRLRPRIKFYQERVPCNTHWRLIFKLLLLSVTVTSSVFARFEYSHVVTIATAFASMVIAYSEFADADRKVER